MATHRRFRAVFEPLAALSLLVIAPWSCVGCASRAPAPAITEGFDHPLPRGQVTYFQTYPDGTRGGASFTLRGEQ